MLRIASLSLFALVLAACGVSPSTPVPADRFADCISQQLPVEYAKAVAGHADRAISHCRVQLGR